MSERTVAQVAGENAKRLRLERGLTLELLARECRQFGLRWTGSKLGDFEGGRVSPTLPTLYSFCLALNSVSNEYVSLAELFEDNGPVRLNPDLVIPCEAIQTALRGTPIDPGNELLRDPVALAATQRRAVEESSALASIRALLRQYAKSLPLSFPNDFTAAISTTGLADTRAADDLHLTPNELLFHALRLWGRSFTAERDDRAGADANAQRLGQVTRTLKDELREALPNGND